MHPWTQQFHSWLKILESLYTHMQSHGEEGPLERCSQEQKTNNLNTHRQEKGYVALIIELIAKATKGDER